MTSKEIMKAKKSSLIGGVASPTTSFTRAAGAVLARAIVAASATIGAVLRAVPTARTV